MPVWFVVILAAGLGAVCASFGQCAVTRSRQGRSWVTGRSTCDGCGRQLRWFENIPLVSFILQRGRSRCCGQRLSNLYVFGELFTAMVTGAAVWWFLTR